MKANSSELCEILNWDTNFFGFCVGHVLGHQLSKEIIQQIDLWSLENNLSCLYLLASSNDAETIRIAEDNGFRLVDIRMTYEKLIHRNSQTSEEDKSLEFHLRSASPRDANALGSIARESHRDSRFYYDRNIPSYLSDMLFETWIKLSCEGYADKVLVAELDNSPVGYITCHIVKNGAEARTGRIGLIGVINSVRGMGVAHLLLVAALDWFFEEGIRRTSVVTQGRNLTAQRLYQRHGFLTSTVEIWYHKWYKNPKGQND